MSSLVRKMFSQNEVRIGIVLLSPIIFAALFANFLTSYNPLTYSGAPPLQAPTLLHPMGTDQVGGDIFSQVVYGARVALYVAVVSTIISTSIAITLGLVAGYFAGLLGEVIMRVTDFLLSLPAFVLIILLIVLFGSNINNLIIVIGLVSWPSIARIIRAEVLSLKERDFVLSAKSIGAGSLNIMFDEILPNVWFKVMPAVSLQAGLSIVIEAGVSFLGLGDPNVSSWGRTLMFAYQSVYSSAWWGLLFPTAAIVLSVIGLNLLGEGISKALTPRISA